MGQKKKPLEVSDSDFDFNHSYNELQNVLVEMHGDVMNAFKKIGSQKRIILKLEAEILKIKKDFELFKKEHASLKNEQFEIPTKESLNTSAPNTSKSKNNGTCEACPKLHEEITSLKNKIEQASGVPMDFDKISNNFNSHYKKSCKRKFQNKHRNREVHGHKVRCHYCREVRHTTPHCHALKNVIPRELMRWVPKQSIVFTNPKDPTHVGDLNVVGVLFNH